jgi:cell division septation protein DedD
MPAHAPEPAPPSASPLPAPRPASEPARSTAAGRWRVQLGAIATQEKAEEHWQALVRKLPQLGRLPHTVMQAGAIWRLQATGLSSRAEAQDLCTAVIARNGVCIALGPAPTTAP